LLLLFQHVQFKNRSRKSGIVNFSLYFTYVLQLRVDIYVLSCGRYGKVLLLWCSCHISNPNHSDTDVRWYAIVLRSLIADLLSSRCVSGLCDVRR